MKVGSLELDLLLNRTDFDRTIKEAERDAQRFRSMDVSLKPTFDMGGVKQVRTEIQTEVGYLNRWLKLNTITPEVNHDPLTALNKHLDLKQQHIDRLNRHLRSNPITPQVDLSGLKKVHSLMSMSSGKKYRIEVEAKQSGGVQQRRQEILAKQTASVLKEGIKEGFKEANKGSILGALTAPIKQVIGGSLFRLGQNVTDRGVQKFAATERGAGLFEELDRATENVAEAFSKRLDNLASTLGGYDGKNDAARALIKDLSVLTEAVIDPEQFDSLWRESSNNIAKSIVRIESGASDLTTEIVKGLFAVQSQFKTQINNAAYRLIQTAALPVKFNAQVQAARSADRVQEVINRDTPKGKVKRFQNVTENPELQGKEILTLLAPGFQKEQGKAGIEIQKMLEPFFDLDKTALIPIRNTYTDRKANDSKSELNDYIVDLFGSNPLGQEGLSMVMNIEKLLGTSLQGVNPDSVRMAALAVALQEKFPNVEVQLAGFSGGGYIVEEAIAILEMLGKADIKGLGFGSPLMGLTNRASGNFQAVVGNTDPLTFGYLESALGELPESIKSVLVDKLGIPQTAVGQGIVNPPENVNILSDFAGGHDLQAYLQSEQGQALMRSHLSGTKKVFNSAELPAELQDAPGLQEILAMVSSSDILDSGMGARSLANIGQIQRKLLGSNAVFEEAIANPDSTDITRLGKMLGATSESLAKFERVIKALEGTFRAKNFTNKPEGYDNKYIDQALKLILDEIPYLKSAKENVGRVDELKTEASRLYLEKSGYSPEVLDRIDPSSYFDIASYVGKRQNDDRNVLRGIEKYQNPDKIPTTKGSFEFYDPKEADKRVNFNFRDYIKLALEGLVKELPESLQAEGTEFVNNMKRLQQAWAKYISEGVEVPQEIIEDAIKVLKQDTKLDLAAGIDQKKGVKKPKPRKSLEELNQQFQTLGYGSNSKREEYQPVNPFDIPRQLEIPFNNESTIDSPLVPLHQATNDRLDTIVNLLMGNQIGEPHDGFQPSDLAPQGTGGIRPRQPNVDLSESIKDLVPANDIAESPNKTAELAKEGLAQTEELGRSAIASFGKGIFRGLDSFYQLAKETEKRFLDLDPSGGAKFGKKALQLTAVPAMATMAASGLPGIEQAIAVIHGLVDLGFHDLAQGLSTGLMESVSRTMPDFFAPMMDKLSTIGFADIGDSVTQLREVPQHLMDALTDYTLGNVGRTASDIAMGSGAMKVAGDAYNNLQDRTAPEILAEQNSALAADIAQRLNTPLPGDSLRPDSTEIDAEIDNLKLEQQFLELGQAAEMSAALLNKMFTGKGLVKLAPIAGIKSNTDIDGKPLNKAGVKDVAKYLADNLSEVELAKAISQMPKDRSLYKKNYKDSGIEKPVLSETGYKEFIELMFSAKAEIENIDLATNADEAIAKLERYKAEAQAVVAIFELPGSMAQGRGAAVADLNQTKLAVEAYREFGNINDLIAKMNSAIGEGAIKADRHWGKTTADIFKNFAALAAEAKDKGYDIQKALSKGSPGLLTNIEGHWDKAKVKLKSTFDDIAEGAEESGSKIELALKEDLQGLNYTELGEYIGEAISKGIDIEADLSNIKDTLEDLNLENPQKIKALLLSTQKSIKELESEIGIGASKAGKHWGNTTEDILKQFQILSAEAKDKGYDIQRFISEGSPGPTEKIRKHWQTTTKYLLDRINKIQQLAKVSGSTIQKAFEANPEMEHRLERIQRKLLEMNSLLNNTDALGAIARGGNELEGSLQQFLANKHTGIEQIESGNLPAVDSVTDNSAIMAFQEHIDKAESDRLARAKQLQAIHRATASHYASVTKETDKAAKAEQERLERVKQVQAIHRATASHYAAAGGKPDEQLALWQKLISKAKEYQNILFGQGQQTNVENDPLQVLDNAYQAYASTIDNAPNSVDIFNGIKKFTDDMREKSPIFGKILDFGKNVGISAAAILSFDYLADNIARIGTEVLLAGRDLQRFEIQMEAIGKSGEAVSSRIFDRSQELGTNYLTSRQGYQRFSQATQGIGNESIIDPIFEGFQKAFVAKQATAEQQARGYTAIEQIFSKGGLDGSVQSEELKGQLSEALPGAYQTAAKVRGQSPRELAEDMKAAQVEAADLLIRMAAFYEVDSEILLRINSGSFDAELNRLTNNLQLFKEEAGEDLLPFGKAGLQAVNVGLNLLSENFALVSNVSGVLLLKFLTSLTKSMLEVARSTKLGTVALKAFGIESALSSIKNRGLYAGGIKPSAKGLLGIGKSIAPIAIASIAAQKVYGEFTAGSEDVKESTKIVSEIARSKSDKPGGDDNLFKRARRKTNEFLNPLNFDNESRLSDIKDISKGLKDIKAINQDVFDNLNSEETVKIKDELAEIESQISKLQGLKINLLRSGDSNELDEVDKKLAEIQVKKKELFKELSGDLAISQKTEKSLETYLSKLEELKPFISEAAYNKGEDRIKEIARAVGINIKTIERNMEAAASRADFIIRDIKDSISNANFSLDIKLKENNIANIDKRIKGVLSDRTLEIAKTVDLLANLEGKASNLKENKSSLRGSILREKNLDGAKAALGVASNDELFSTLKETSTDAIQGLIENAKESPELVKVLNLLANYIDVSAQETDSREQVSNTRLELTRQNREYSRSLYEFGSSLRDFARSLEDLAIEKQRFEVDFPLQIEDAVRNITRSSRDLAEQYDDFILGLDRQILQTELELAQITKQIKNTRIRNDINSSQIGQQGFGRDLADLYLQYAESVQSDEEIELQLNLDRLSVEETVLQNTRQIRNITEQRRSLERDRLEQQRQLTRQQQDFYRQQKRQQEGILDQWYNINLQAQELGVAVNLTNQGFAQQGKGLIAQIQFLSESIRAKSEELRQAPMILPAADVLPVPTANIPSSNWNGPLPLPPPTVYGPPVENKISPSAPEIPQLTEFNLPSAILSTSTTAPVSLPGVDNINTSGEAEEKTKSVEDLTLEKLNQQRTLTKEQEAEKLINFLNGFKLKQLEINEFFRSQERQTAATAYESEKQSANAKGYLTADEEIDFAGRDVAKQYGDRNNDLQDRIRVLQKQFDSAEGTITKFSDPKYAGDEQIQQVLESAQNTRTRAADLIAEIGREQIVIDLEIDTAVDVAETNKAIELDFQRRADELGLRREVTEGQKGLAPSTIHDLGYNKDLREIGKVEIDLDYEKQLKELDRLRGKNGEITDQYRVMKKALDDLNAVKLEQLYIETNGLVSLFDEVAQPALNGLLDDFIDKSVTAADAWGNFARSIIDSLADILMAYAKNEALRMIFGGAGQNGVDITGKTEQKSGVDWGAALGLGAKALSQGSQSQESKVKSQELENNGFDIASAANIAAGFVPLIFSDGGDTEAMYIPNYREGADTRSLALAKGMEEAMARENHPDAFPAVLHKGEVVLTDLNGDAQLVREKRRTGEWEQMKRTTYQPLKVENYRNGSEGIAAMGRSGATIVNNYTSSVNVRATDANSFKATETQIARRQRLQMERSKR